MKRDAIDLADVPHHQQDTHEALLEWARWCSARPKASICPMFRGFRAYLYPEAAGGRPIDQLMAIRVQKAYVTLPDRHRTVLGWWYCHPHISVSRVRRELATTKAELAQMVIDARSMIRNRLLTRHAEGG